MKKLNYAIILALLAALISGINNFLTKVAVNAVKDPLVFTTLKNILVAVFLVSMAITVKKWQEIKKLGKKQFLLLILIGIIGGSLPFALYFIGLSQTSAVNASLIHKTLFFWIAILALPIFKEKPTRPQWLGVTLIFTANLIIGGFKGFNYNQGELMIFIATIFWAGENIVAKIALRNISSLTVAASRMFLGSIILLIIIFFQGKTGMLFSLNQSQWQITVITSVLLLGYVICWYTALKHAPVTLVASLLLPATLVTNVLSAIFVTHQLNWLQIMSLAIFVLGIGLTVISVKRTSQANQELLHA